jgi:AmmeMemoRadiSam system protein A
MHLSSEQSAALLNLARRCIREALRGTSEDVDRHRREPHVYAPADAGLHQPAGCFVSLHHLASHRLRGCVGRLEAQDPVYVAVARTAVGVLSDPRFHDHRVTFNELPTLSIEISVLSPLRDAAHVLDFDPVHDGIVLTCGPHGGCFLPQVARETGWTREQLLDRLCVEKMGLRAGAWREDDVKLETFTTLILGPEAFGQDPVPATVR